MNEIFNNNLNLHEIKGESLVDYARDFEMIGELSVGEKVRKTVIRFKNFNDYEHQTNSIDQNYDREGATFND